MYHTDCYVMLMLWYHPAGRYRSWVA